MVSKRVIFGLLRISLGWTFLWAFFDKLIGLGFTTCRQETGEVVRMCTNAWLAGGSPTTGFLKFATHGPFAGFFQSLAGSGLVDWLFMAGLLGIGIALTLGIMMRIAVGSGVAMLSLMYLAVLPPEHNPVTDEHIIYGLLLLSFLFMPVGEWLGAGRWWAGVVRGKRWLA